MLAARAGARRFVSRFEQHYSALRNDIDQLLACFRHKSFDQRTAITTG
jgi:hypothetical protein